MTVNRNVIIVITTLSIVVNFYLLLQHKHAGKTAREWASEEQSVRHYWGEEAVKYESMVIKYKNVLAEYYKCISGEISFQGNFNQAESCTVLMTMSLNRDGLHPIQQAQ